MRPDSRTEALARFLAGFSQYNRRNGPVGELTESQMSTTIETSEEAADHVATRKPRARAATPQKGQVPCGTHKPGKPETKTEIVLKKLRAGKGASIAQLGEATGWQAHSVRGFLSATVKKKLGLSLTSDVGKDGVRRYRISES